MTLDLLTIIVYVYNDINTFRAQGGVGGTQHFFFIYLFIYFFAISPERNWLWRHFFLIA